jgi:hypothetical protein
MPWKRLTLHHFGAAGWASRSELVFTERRALCPMKELAQFLMLCFVRLLCAPPLGWRDVGRDTPVLGFPGAVNAFRDILENLDQLGGRYRRY